MKKLRLIFATLLIVWTSALAHADDIDAIDRLSPSQFEAFADRLYQRYLHCAIPLRKKTPE